MLPDLAKIIAADQTGQETMAQAQQEALALKRQAEARVRESQAQLQDDLARVRQAAQTEILAAAEARAAEIAAATERQVQDLTDKGKARQAVRTGWKACATGRTFRSRVGSCYWIWQKSSSPTKPVKERWPRPSKRRWA